MIRRSTKVSLPYAVNAAAMQINLLADCEDGDAGYVALIDRNDVEFYRMWIGAKQASFSMRCGGRYLDDETWLDDLLHGRITAVAEMRVPFEWRITTERRPERVMPERHHSVALDALGAGAIYTGEGTGGHSWNHTLGSGSDFALDISGCNFNPTNPTTTTATYNGVSWTSRGVHSQSGGTNVVVAQVFGEANPPSGTNSAAVAFSNATNHGLFNSRSWTGVDQTTPYGTPVQGGGANAGAVNSAGAATTPTDGALIDAFGSHTTAGLTGNKTLDYKQAVSGNDFWTGCQHDFTAGSQTLTWTTVSGGAFRWAHAIVPVSASGGAAAATGFGPLLSGYRNRMVIA